MNLAQKYSNSKCCQSVQSSRNCCQSLDVNPSRGSITCPINPILRQAALSIVSKHGNLLTCGGSHEHLPHHDNTPSRPEETTPIVKVLAGFSLLNTLSTWQGERKRSFVQLQIFILGVHDYWHWSSQGVVRHKHQLTSCVDCFRMFQTSSKQM